MGCHLRRILTPVFAMLLAGLLAVPVSACPFCSTQGQTLTAEVNQASFVLYGRLENAQLKGAEFGEGSTDLVVDNVIKEHEFVKGKKVVTIPRYIPSDKDTKYKFLVFCDVFKGKLDPYRGLAVKADSDMPKYLAGAVKVKDAKPGERLRYFFDWLDNSDAEISNDALKEFGNASYTDYRDMAKDLPADKLIGWLKDPKTPAFRFGLYASLLGHCGKKEDAKVLHDMLEDPVKGASSGVDGLLAGYLMLDPKEGWAYLTNILKSPDKDFPTRYAALRTVHFFWDYRPDVVSKQQMVDGVATLLDQGDIADLAIEDMRKWKRSEFAPKILGLREKKSHDNALVRRAILRYALSCTENEQAKAFVDEARKKNLKDVQAAEELLKLEASVATPSNGSTPAPKK